MKTDEPASTADGSGAQRETGRVAVPAAGAVPDRPGGTAPASPSPSGARTAAPSAVGENLRREEAVALLRLTERLKAAYPFVDPSAVDRTVATAHASFRQAKVRTYVPILVERRVRVLLDAVGHGEVVSVPADVGGPAATRPPVADTREQPSGRPARSALRDRWIPARLRPAHASGLGGGGERS
jgi:hypothetical protein